ncbi:MAG TPA: M28 family peptidase [Candidatus Latescibacteria bacterium]|nr:M28 family peptidase [Candidatus Latescibacterota bacterium]
MRLGDVLLAAVLGVPTLVVALVGPGRLTQTALGHLDWSPYVEEPERRAAPSLRSRVVGYPGSEEAYRYIKEEFERIGLENITAETFPVVVPLDLGAKLKVLDTGELIPLYCLWPNQVKPPSLPSEGVEGPLIYGGKGSFRELDGKEVQGSIVLLDFDCGQNYLNPRTLGAKAVIFYDNGGGTREQAAEKFLKVPVDVPRFWADGEGAGRLLELARKGERVRLRASMRWEEVEAKNVYGFLYGSDEQMPPGERRRQGRWKDQIVVLEAYYDAMSVVPALAPGAENACGITALLHIARVLKEHPPKYTVVFLATSAHFEGLSGVNNFLYRHSRKSDFFRKRIPTEERIDFRLFVGLDLSSGDDRVAAFTMGTFYNPNWGTNNYQKNMMAPYAKKFSKYSEELFPGQERFVDAIAPSKRTWKNFMPVPLALDHEAAAFVGFGAISFVTPDDARERVDTPLDRFEYVDVRALTRQIQTIAGLLLCATKDPDFFVEAKLNLKDRGHSLKGIVYWFNREVHFAVPQDPVPGALVVYQQPGPNSVAGVRTLMVARTGTERGEKGRFFFDILRNTWSNRILAYQSRGGLRQTRDFRQGADVHRALRDKVPAHQCPR